MQENKNHFSVVHLIVGILSMILVIVSGGTGFFRGCVNAIAGYKDVSILVDAEMIFSGIVIVAGIMCFINVTLRKKIFTIISSLCFLLSSMPLLYYFLKIAKLSESYDEPILKPTTLFCCVIVALVCLLALLISFIFNYRKYRR